MLIPGISGLITIIVLNIAINEVENKIPNLSVSVENEIMTLKTQILKKNISPLLIIINLRTK